MAYYSRIEQETHYNYDPVTGFWSVYSTYPPHIKKILKNAKIADKETDEEGQVIAVTGFVDANQIRLFKKRL
ncbi:hypothetical protein [Ureibacillus terrenus]|uniref:hypothetical protein n=1 Tax=Ureibacillus terrenus TaxID=118246 RepID=UPI002E2505F8|nr:hypothetical protein [Ureibacillus terrenus]